MIGITGASGQLGQGILKLLLERVSPREITAITRTPGKLADFAARGVNVRPGDFENPAGLAPAFKGIDKLLIIPTSDLRPGARKTQHRAAIKAAAEAGVRHIVYISTVGAKPGPDLFDAHFFTEIALFDSGKAWTVIRMSLYADNLLGSLPQAIKSGTYPAPASAPTAYVSRDDVAAVAAGVMATADHEGVTYFATGPRAVTPADIASATTRVASKPISWVPITNDQLRQWLAASGLPDVVVRAYVDIQEAAQAGAFDLVSGDTARFAGRPAEPLDAFLSRKRGILLSGN
jgi:NAD(P)H dehydrogenase (quinone)